MKINSKTLSISFFWSFLEQGGSSVISLLVQVVLARLLLPDDFGIMAILLVVTNLLNTLAQSGFGSALIQKTNATRNSFSTAFWLSMAFSIALYSLLFATAPLIAQVYSMPELALYLRVLGVSVFLESFNSIQRSFLQKKLQFKTLFRVNCLALLIGSLIGVFLALNGGGIWSLILQVLAQTLSSSLIFLHKVPWKPNLVFEKKEAQAIFTYGWKICLTSILGTFYTGLSELVIGKTNTAYELGIYSQGRKWPCAAMNAVNSALQNVLFPALSNLQDDIKSFRRAVEKILNSGFFITAPICLLAAVIAEPAVAILLGENWLPCTLIFQFACLGYLPLMPQVVNLRAYMALGKSDLYLKLQIIKVTSGAITFCCVAVFTHNIYLVAAAVLIHTVFCVLAIDMPPAKHIYGLSMIKQLKIIFPTALMSCLAAAIANLIQVLQLDYFLQMVIQVLVFIIVYTALAKLTNCTGLQTCLDALKQLIGR